jgi:prepilin-type N-terminal cleavage/methylation domain-containing protein
MHKRPAFTLIEVLISIMLLGIILPALYSSVDLLRDSNTHLLEYLEKSKKVTQATDTLFLDIASSDGNLTIQKDEFSRFCIEQTQNSLYALSSPRVCWIVLKKERILVRVEGIGYMLPLRSEERVEVDPIMKGIEIFDVYRSKDKEKSKVLVLLQQKGKEPISFMVQGISKPKPPKKKKKKQNKNNKDKNTTTFDDSKTSDSNTQNNPHPSRGGVPQRPNVPGAGAVPGDLQP